MPDTLKLSRKTDDAEITAISIQTKIFQEFKQFSEHINSMTYLKGSVKNIYDHMAPWNEIGFIQKADNISESFNKIIKFCNSELSHLKSILTSAEKQLSNKTALFKSLPNFEEAIILCKSLLNITEDLQKNVREELCESINKQEIKD